MSTNPSLPQELYDMILACNCDDPHFLGTSALVCKSWVPFSRAHMFRRLGLSFSELTSVQEFIELALSPHVTFLPYIRKVCYCSTRRFDDAFRYVDLTMESVTELELTDSFAIPKELPSLFPNVRHLKLAANIYGSGTVKDAYDFIGQWPLLTLCVPYLIMPTQDHEMHPYALPSTLNSLILVCSSHYNEIMVRPCIAPKLEHVTLANVQYRDISLVVPFLISLPEGCRSLAFQGCVEFFNVLLDSDSLPSLLPLFSRLESLSIDGGPAPRPVKSIALVDFHLDEIFHPGCHRPLLPRLLQYLPPSLHTLGLWFHHSNIADILDMDWDAIRGVLNAPQLRGLREIRVKNCTVKPRENDGVEEAEVEGLIRKELEGRVGSHSLRFEKETYL